MDMTVFFIIVNGIEAFILILQVLFRKLPCDLKSNIRCRLTLLKGNDDLIPLPAGLFSEKLIIFFQTSS